MKIVLLGTAWPYRGGLASFNERLIKQFSIEGHDARIITFTLQYPSILFPGKTQYSESPAPADINISRKVNSINPFNWRKTGKEIKAIAPDILIIKYWMPFMAPCFGTIASIAKTNKKTKVVCIADNIIPHEQKFYDRSFTRFFIKNVDAFVVMSDSVLRDLAQFNRSKLRAKNPHPLFDNFGEKVSKEIACSKLGLDTSKNYILFFGFIRAYKGLDLLLRAFADLRIRELNIQLIIAGEFYEDEKPYKQLINELHLTENVHSFPKFISDEEVKNYFCAADLVVQPYKNATQSGVTQIAYHFEVPMLVTDVGGLSELVPDQQVGYVVDVDVNKIADAIVNFYTLHRKDDFVSNIVEEKKRFGWDRMVKTIIDVAR